MIVTRFAPSPTGALHLGHAASALFAAMKAREADGTFLLRIEDIDPVRCKPEYIDGIYEDLKWLGLSWPLPVRLQSQHMDDYAAALQSLRERDLLYPCFCTRKEVIEEAMAAGTAPHMGPDGVVYPGACRHLSQQQRDDLAAVRTPVWRLDMEKAIQQAGGLRWRDLGKGEIVARPQDFGDIVLARKDVSTSYHLSVTVDDALQGVTLVTRGEDLLRSTDIHRLLQSLLGYPAPDYHHHSLLTDKEGKRLAKRDGAVTLRALRESGEGAEHIYSILGTSGFRIIL